MAENPESNRERVEKIAEGKQPGRCSVCHSLVVTDADASCHREWHYVPRGRGFEILRWSAPPPGDGDVGSSTIRLLETINFHLMRLADVFEYWQQNFPIPEPETPFFPETDEIARAVVDQIERRPRTRKPKNPSARRPKRVDEALKDLEG